MDAAGSGQLRTEEFTAGLRKCRNGDSTHTVLPNGNSVFWVAPSSPKAAAAVSPWITGVGSAGIRVLRAVFLQGSS